MNAPATTTTLTPPPPKPSYRADADELQARVPLELAAVPRWVCWRYEVRKDGSGWTKTPKQTNGLAASSTNPATWSNFEDVVRAVRMRSDLDGVGFVLGDGWAASDYDHVIDETGNVRPEFVELVNAIPAGLYVERSPGGDGLRVIGRTTLKQLAGCSTDIGHGAKLERWTSGKYVTVTARAFRDPPGDAGALIDEYLKSLDGLFAKKPTPANLASRSRPTFTTPRLDDDALLERIDRSRSGPAFRSLWSGNTTGHGGDDSRADLALCNHLAFWTNRDPEQIDRLFRRSGLMREKWDQRSGPGQTYGTRTIARAIADTAEGFTAGDSVRVPAASVPIVPMPPDLAAEFSDPEQAMDDDATTAAADAADETTDQATDDGTDETTAPPEADPLEQARQRIAEAIAKATESKSVTAAFDVADDLAKLPTGEREDLIGQFQDALGSKLKVRTLKAEISERRRQAKRAVVLTRKPKLHLLSPWMSTIRRTARAIAEANDPPTLFTRSGELVYLRADERGAKLVSSVNDTWMRGQLGRTCVFINVTEGRGEIEVPPPVDIAKDHVLRLNETLEAMGRRPIPPLVSVVEVPFLRADGSIVATPGYDRPSGIYYWPDAGLSLPTIPDSPTEQHVADALALLEEAVGDFPFAGDIDQANAIGLLLTCVVRPLCELTPVALVDAPQAGTGKSLLARLVHVVRTGRDAPMTTLPEQDDECRKLITSLMLDGASTIVFDNTDGAVHHGSLCKLVTGGTWSDRQLGASKTIAVPQQAVVLITGNNVQLAGDMPRRCYRIRLDARSSRPWDDGRQFRHPDLIPWAIANRGRLIAALLTLCRHWYASGRPTYDVPRLGSFETWCGIVGNVLAAAGVHGFLQNRDELYEQSDEDGPQWERFLLAWRDRYGDQPIAISTLEDDVLTDADLRESLPDAFAGFIEKVIGQFNTLTYRIRESGRFKIRLGKGLKARIGRRFGKQQIFLTRTDDAHSKTALWSVRVAGSAGSGGSVSSYACAEGVNSHV